MGGDLPALGDDLVHRLHHRGTTNRKAAAAIGAHSERDLPCIAVDHLRLIDRHAKLRRDKLREGGFMSLAVTVRAGEHRDAAGRMHANVGTFVQACARTERAHHGRRRYAAGLDIGGHADAEQLVACLGGGAA